jgi:mono/diheme cytochrome c family protein
MGNDAAMPRVLFATLLSLLLATALGAETRKWTSKDGRYSTEAELVEADDANATLKKPSGETVTVSVERLSEADHRYLRARTKKPPAAKENAAKENAAKENAAKENATKENATKENVAKENVAKENLVSYTQEVQPLLSQYCAECHKGSAAKDGYDVTSYAALIRRGEYGALVVPGKPDISRLSEVLQGMSKSMPPMGSAQPTAEETAKIKAWIAAGAQDDSPPPSAGKARTSGPRRPARQTP